MEIVIYILFYHYFITSSFHPYPSLLYSSTILLSYPYPFPLSYPLIYQPLFYHILFTFTLSPFYYHTNISFYTFQDKKKIYILPIIYNYYKYLYQKIQFYTILLILLHILYLFILLLLLYTSFTYHSTTISNTSLHTHRHIDRHTHTHTQRHIDRHIVKFNSLLNIEYISIPYYFTYIPNTLPKQTNKQKKMKPLPIH